MTREEHMKRHEELHKSLDELVADYVSHTYNFSGKWKSLSDTSIMELMTWSASQMTNPTASGCEGVGE